MAAGSGIATASYIISALAAAGGVAQGADAARAARSGRRRQGEAQQRAEAAAISQDRKNQQAENRANRKKPDIAAILAGARSAGGGISSTLLSGTGGVASNSLSLGTTRLGA